MDALRRQPWLAIGGVLAAWAVLGAVNVALHLLVDDLETSVYLGFSVSNLEPHLLGAPWLLAMLALVLGAAVWAPRRAWVAAVVGAGALILGNLGQGGIEAAFVDPTVAFEIQYWHDAVRVTDAGAFLAGFNAAQPDLLVHTRTHPPFAIVTMVWAMQALPLPGPWAVLALWGLPALALAPLTAALVRTVGGSREDAFQLALLAAVTPSLNVYGLVCLDSLITPLVLAALLGLALARRGRPGVGVPLFALATVAVNALTFGGTFLLAVGGLLAVHDAWRGRRALGTPATWGSGLALLVAGLLLGGAMLAWLALGYDHLAAFRVASALENPGGPYLLAQPVNYGLTRVESVVELALFLGVATCGWLLRSRRADWPIETVAALIVFGLMLAVGAFRTAETARAVAFLVPLLLLPLRGLDRQAWVGLVGLVALQTAATQLVWDTTW